MGPAEPLFTPRACSACTKRVSRPVQATDTCKSNVFLALWKMSHVDISRFKMSPRTCVLCQKTWLRPSTAPSNVLNVMSKIGLQDGGTEILLLRMAFTLKKLTRHHSPFNVRIYENASPLLNLRQGWFSHFENHVRLSIYLTGRVFVKSKKKMYRVQIPRQETFGKCKFKDMERTLAKPDRGLAGASGSPARRRKRPFGAVQQILCTSVSQEYPQRVKEEDGEERELHRSNSHWRKKFSLEISCQHQHVCLQGARSFGRGCSTKARATAQTPDQASAHAGETAVTLLWPLD